MIINVNVSRVQVTQLLAFGGLLRFNHLNLLGFICADFIK